MKAIKYLDVRILVNKYFQSSITKLLFSTHISLLDKYTQGFNFKVQRKNKFLRMIKPHDDFINLKPRGEKLILQRLECVGEEKSLSFYPPGFFSWGPAN